MFTFSLVVSDMQVITTVGRVERMLTDKLILQLCKSAPYVFMYLVRGNPSEEYIIGSIIKMVVSVVMEKEEGGKKGKKNKRLTAVCYEIYYRVEYLSVL